MPDLHEMTALDYLRWEERRRDSFGALGVLMFVRAGITDLDLIYSDRPQAYGGVSALVKIVGRVDPPLVEADLDMLPLVGAPIYAEDRDNAADWYVVAQRLAAAQADNHWDYHTNSMPPRRFTTRAFAAGRGPTWARRVLDAAIAHKRPPLAYGFDLSPAEWESLAASGVPDLAALRGYLDAGCTVGDAARFAADGVPGGAALVAHRHGIPQTSWVERLAGIPNDWVPYGDEDENLGTTRARNKDPEKDGPLSRGHTLDDLKAYADAGWGGQVHRYTWTSNGMHYGTGRAGGYIALTPELCRRLVAAGITPDDLKRWVPALTTASQGYRGDADYVPPLTDAYRWSDNLLPAVIRLKDAGVKPSHVNDYRYSGCRSVDDVLRCVAAGITGTRVAYLRKKYGARRYSHQSPRLTLRDLLAAHESDTAQEATA